MINSPIYGLELLLLTLFVPFFPFLLSSSPLRPLPPPSSLFFPSFSLLIFYRTLFKIPLKFLGLLSSKAVLFVTNNPEYLAQCNEVIFMRQGRILDQGPHNLLLGRSKDYENFCESAAAVQMRKDEPSLDVLLVDPQSEKTDDSGLSARPSPTSRSDSHQKLTAPTDSLFDIPSALEDGKRP